MSLITSQVEGLILFLSAVEMSLLRSICVSHLPVLRRSANLRQFLIYSGHSGLSLLRAACSPPAAAFVSLGDVV